MFFDLSWLNIVNLGWLRYCRNRFLWNIIAFCDKSCKIMYGKFECEQEINYFGK